MNARFLAVVLLCAWVVMPLPAGAETIALPDGRVFENATVASQSGTRVVIRHEGGLVSIEKEKLPDNLKAQYPTFEDRPAVVRAEAAKPVRRAPTVAASADRGPVRDSSAAPAEFAMEQDRTQALSVGTSLAESYFRSRHATPGGRVNVTVRMDSAEAVTGWPDRWRVRGSAVLYHYRDELMNPEISQLRERLGRDKTLSAKEIRRRIEAASYLRSETLQFEAYVSKLHGTPEIDVSIR
ncbi:hypothetical protein DB347_24520 [Opitutaceae bacterium EW11]|nr:hypothetical protein DB347_24520 [Opitutaceae bacterium EW11]